MKKCCTEIMKNIKDLEKRKFDLVDFEKRNDCDVYLSNEKRIPSNYDYEKVKKELKSIDDSIRYLKGVLSKANIETKLEGYDMNICEGLIYLSQLNNTLAYLKIQANRDELSRRTPYTSRNDVVEYKKVRYDLAKAKSDYKKTLEEVYNIQMAIDRSNLNNYIEVDESKINLESI